MPVPSGPHWNFDPEHAMKSAPSARMSRFTSPGSSAPSITVVRPCRCASSHSLRIGIIVPVNSVIPANASTLVRGVMATSKRSTISSAVTS